MKRRQAANKHTETLEAGSSNVDLDERWHVGSVAADYGRNAFQARRRTLNSKMLMRYPQYPHIISTVDACWCATLKPSTSTDGAIYVHRFPMFHVAVVAVADIDNLALGIRLLIAESRDHAFFNLACKATCLAS